MTSLSRGNNIFTWVSRLRHSRGFGVQSPSAYHFIVDVINGKCRSGVPCELSDIGRKRRKMCELYFRINSFWRADTWIDFVYDGGAYIKYLNAALETTRVVNDIKEGYFVHGRTVVRLSDKYVCDKLYDKVACLANDNTLVIIEGIDKNPKWWRKVVADERVGVTFDLRTCGIVFFDKVKYKRNYVTKF